MKTRWSGAAARWPWYTTSLFSRGNALSTREPGPNAVGFM